MSKSTSAGPPVVSFSAGGGDDGGSLDEPEGGPSAGRRRAGPGLAAAAPRWKKFAKYRLDVDDKQDDRATEILLCDFSRPHMRAFHCAWWSYFMAVFVWFSIVPLLPYISEDLKLTRQDIWTSNIAGVGSTIAARLIVGPLCDAHGSRILVATLLCIFSIPAACLGMIKTPSGLTTVRFFIGILGGTFVVCQYWCSRMFAKQVVGTAQGLTAGWGTLGAGMTNLVLGSILMPIFIAMCNGNTELAWRTVSVVPAVLAIVTGLIICNISDDAPKGDYDELRKYGQFPNPQLTAWGSWKKGSLNHNTWIMFIQNAASFGVEITMQQASALYFKEEYGLSAEACQAIASMFGWLNFFARGLGGVISDWANVRWGMRGRLWALTLMLLVEGAMVFVFSSHPSLAGALVSLVVFSLFVHFSEGTNMAIVPYIDPRHTGTVTGITGAGGNFGGVIFGFCFRELSYDNAFWAMGCCVFASAFFSVFVKIPGHAGLLWGRDQPVNLETGEVMVSRCSTTSRSDASGSASNGRRDTLASSRVSKE